ncbi:MAG: acyltransferase family protein [Microgenomates group bacterium]
MVTNKIGWISSLRGLAILAVVFGHMATPWSRYIYAWHMPLVFFISGYLIKDFDWKKSVRIDGKYVVKIMIVFGLLAVLMEIVKRFLFPQVNFAVNNFSLGKELLNMFWWVDEGSMVSYGLVLWFLPAWFWGKILIKYLINTTNWWIATLLSLGAWFYLANNVFRIPLGIDKGLFISVWMILGVIYKKYQKYFVFKYIGIVLLIFILSVRSLPIINLGIKMADPLILATVYPLVILLFLVGLFEKIEVWVRWLEWWGDRSIWVYLIHMYVNNVTYLLRWGQFGWVIQFGLSVIILYLLLKLIDYVKTTRYTNLIDWV